jgi:predicted RNA methylase
VTNRSDRFYTPPHVADVMLSCVSDRSPRTVADFAAGDGALLELAGKRWRRAQLVANDIDRTAARGLRAKHDDWRVETCDFLGPRVRNTGGRLADLVGTTSLILLNPPFSCRGHSTQRVRIDDVVHSCSTAMAFVLTSFAFLRRHGILVAVLPSGTLNSEKDQGALQWLRSRAEVSIIQQNGRQTFPGCNPRTAIVRITRVKNGDGNAKSVREKPLQSPSVEVSISRGCMPIYLVEPRSRNARMLPMLHTTNIKRGRVLPSHLMTGKWTRTISGPAVLLPRVGRPTPDKVALYESVAPIVLSDCVFALQCLTVDAAEIVRDRLLGAWDSIAASYGGTCAPYLTLRRLTDALNELGIVAAGAGIQA